jgi:hypothetical protein
MQFELHRLRQTERATVPNGFHISIHQFQNLRDFGWFATDYGSGGIRLGCR